MWLPLLLVYVAVELTVLASRSVGVMENIILQERMSTAMQMLMGIKYLADLKGCPPKKPTSYLIPYRRLPKSQAL